MEASARSDIGLVRAVNEDSFLVTDVLFAVADGLGGHEAGEVASRMAIDLLEEHLPYFRSNPADKLRETFTRINTAIHQRSMSDENCKGMGTTLTALLIQDGTAYIGHVGDSRA
ncbi:MAG TPA: serine/threonine-protein phosphatase, partial [Firmicutes bacterium]|nr:serine/threonine-protein phosphatase [Bacillota bacterium]